MHAAALSPREARALGPDASAAVEYFRRPALPAGVRYALLLRDPAQPHEKPLAFASLAELARGIHRRRGRAGLQLVQTELLTRQSETPRLGVSVWITDEAGTGEARRFVGWAYLGGAGRLTLEAALHAERPIARVR